MEFNNANNKNDKNKFRSKSLANNFLVNLSKTEKEKRSSNILSSVSKKESYKKYYILLSF